MQPLYIGHPASQYDGGPRALVQLCAKDLDAHGGWPLRPHEYAANFSLNARNFCSMVLQSLGPVLLINPVKRETVEHIRLRLGARVPVIVEDIASVEELREAIRRVCRQHEDGEPLMALDVVVALLMLRKLDLERMWAGNSKGYMWVSDIPKGRGLDEKYRGRVDNVLNILLMQGLLIFKISNSKRKYALNPERRTEIYEFLRNRKFSDDIQRVLLRYGTVESVRVLDLLDCYNEPAEENGDES